MYTSPKALVTDHRRIRVGSICGTKQTSFELVSGALLGPESSQDSAAAAAASATDHGQPW